MGDRARVLRVWRRTAGVRSDPAVRRCRKADRLLSPAEHLEKKRNDPATEGLLAASGGNVVFYSPDYGDLVQFDESGKILKRVKYSPTPNGKKGYGMALTKSGKVILSIFPEEHRQFIPSISTPVKACSLTWRSCSRMTSRALTSWAARAIRLY